jgi:lysozyme family protein
MDFTTAINRTLGVEGGYVNDPNDPGGETKFGISKRAYPDVDIKNLTREQAVAIYKRDFWDRAHIDAMPALLQYQALDFAVNSGIEIAVTQAAVAAMPGDRLVILFLAARLEFMTKLSNWVSAGKGWALRIVTDMRYAAQDLKGG